jgi:NADP-reducing hydrogenase subunit HndD
MFGAVLKSYYAEERRHRSVKDICRVGHAVHGQEVRGKAPELSATGYPDVDVVLTTRELARMIREAGIDFTELPERHFDDPMGEATGAGVIFGVTGGVMEAALRYLVELLGRQAA